MRWVKAAWSRTRSAAAEPTRRCMGEEPFQNRRVAVKKTLKCIEQTPATQGRTFRKFSHDNAHDATPSNRSRLAMWPDLVNPAMPSRRVLFCLAISASAAVYVGVVVPWLWAAHGNGNQPSDFWPLWCSAQAWLQGQSPYAVVGPGRACSWGYSQYYPFTAIVSVVPLTLVPYRLANVLFVSLSAGALAWTLTRKTLANPQLLVFASAAMMSCAQNGQWAPLLMAGAAASPLAWVLACKPTLGAALLAAYPSRKTILISGGFALLTVILAPWWVSEWRTVLGTAGEYVQAPITQPGGFLLALAALKWRRPEARLLLAMACVPHTPVLADTLILFLVVETLPEALTLFSLMAIVAGVIDAGTSQPIPTWYAVNRIALLWLIYLPCLVMVLRRKNEGVALTWRWRQPVIREATGV